MSDCSDRSGELRDMLPELVASEDGAYGARLAPQDRARLLDHLATCDACRDELELLRTARRAAVAAVPAVDAARIIRALPTPPMGHPPIRTENRRQRRAPWSAWSVAAAVSTIAIAGLSIAIVRGVTRGGADTGRESAVPIVSQPVPSLAPTPHARGAAGGAAERPGVTARPPVSGSESGESPPKATPELEASGGLSNLSEAQLQTVLRDIDNLDATPAAEPDAIVPAVRVAGEPEL